MLDLRLAPQLSVARFRDRIIPAPDGRVLFLSADRKRGSWFTQAEVTNIGNYVAHQAEPTARLLQRSVWMSFPFALALIGISANLKLGKSIDSLGPVASGLFLFITFAGLPLFMLFRHYLVMRSVWAEVEAHIASRELVDAPPSSPKRGLDAVETLGLLFAIPNALAGLIVWIDPDLLRNTPLTASALSPLSIAVVIALAVRRVVGRNARELRPTPQLPETPSRRVRRILKNDEDPKQPVPDR